MKDLFLRPAPLILAAIAVFSIAAWWYSRGSRTPETGTESGTFPLPSRERATTKSILSGTPPHEMTGETAEALQRLTKLPDTGWQRGGVPDDIGQRAMASARAVRALSVLSLEQDTNKDGTVEQLYLSLRGDFIRPDKAHVSQAVWNGDQRYYETDEWVILGDTIYNNSGLWFLVDDQGLAENRSGVADQLLPESALADFLREETEHSGMLTVDGVSYYFLETAMQECPEQTKAKKQIWIESETEHVSKSRLALYQQEALVAEMVVTFVERRSRPSIRGPKQCNDRDADVIEHW